MERPYLDIFFFSSRRRHTSYWRDLEFRRVLFRSRDRVPRRVPPGDPGPGRRVRREAAPRRSEERRVGKESRSRWSPEHEKKKKWYANCPGCLDTRRANAMYVWISIELPDICFFFSSRRRHTRYWRDWSSDVCSSDLLRRIPGLRMEDSSHVMVPVSNR